MRATLDIPDALFNKRSTGPSPKEFRFLVTDGWESKPVSKSPYWDAAIIAAAKNFKAKSSIPKT